MRKTIGLAALISIILIGRMCVVAAAEIEGKVNSVSDKSVVVTMSSDVAPAPGDKAAIFFKIPGTDADVSVASGHVSEVRGAEAVVAIDHATGQVAPGHSVRITSAAPQAPTPAAPPVTTSPSPTASAIDIAQPAEAQPTSPPLPPPAPQTRPRALPPAAAPSPPSAARPVPSATPLSRFAGRWRTQDENGTYYLTLRQHGNHVSGTYNLEAGSVSGTVRGNRLTVTWQQTGNRCGGYAQLQLSADGQTLYGPWQYDPAMFSSGRLGGGVWNMQRVGGSR